MSKAEPEVRAFKREAALIRDEWKSRAGADRLATRRARSSGEEEVSWPEPADDWLRRTAYRFLKGYIARGREGIIIKAFDGAPRKKAGPHSLDGQPFKQGLLALFPKGGGPKRQARADWGDEMQYAFDHLVPPRHYNGFIKLVGRARIVRQKVAKRHVEPGYRHRGYPEPNARHDET